ncbi:hypothetical protein [Litchfieldia alkalitelluris]|uniref:hypothetical protein n=1 Tax=Litchfieldia alkalitelluris TaxID=304268 RepID=UPI000997BF28|nr:hypothetical protein [Litchfieldia alkalitelluris]
MKGCLITVGGVFLFFFIVIIGDYIYYDLVSFRAANAAEKYLEKTYDEDFKVDETEYSKILGEKNGMYYVDAYPVKNPQILARVYVTESIEIFSAEYLENKWRFELNEQLESYISSLTDSFSLRANLSVPEEIEKRYEKEDSYETLLKENPNKLHNMLFLHVYRDPTNQTDQELEWLYELVTYLKEQNLERFTVLVYFYPQTFLETLSEEDKLISYDDFSDKFKGANVNYVFNFESLLDKVQIINSIEQPDGLRSLFKSTSGKNN